MNSPKVLGYDLGEGVLAFSTTRHGGVSAGRHGEFNINEYCGDDRACIAANREALLNWLEIAPDCLVLPHQVHGKVVRTIDEKWMALTPSEQKASLEGVDALMTDLRGVCIGVSTADCIPVLLYDADHHACSAVHAGWRGTVARVVQAAVKAMTDVYQTAPSRLKAVIGPGISREHFEVGDEVYEAFQAAEFDMGRIATRYEKWHIDLWEANYLQLVDMGMEAKSIFMAGICTYAHPDEFFSARRLGVDSGRIFTAIMQQNTTAGR